MGKNRGNTPSNIEPLEHVAHIEKHNQDRERDDAGNFVANY